MTSPAERTLTDDGVTAQTAQALRAAMQRLFAGKPQRTDGRLTKQNLWQEAGVSRATMNRAHTILEEWDLHVAEHGSATPGEARRDEEIAELKRKLAEKTRECTTLQQPARRRRHRHRRSPSRQHTPAGRTCSPRRHRHPPAPATRTRLIAADKRRKRLSHRQSSSSCRGSWPRRRRSDYRASTRA